MSGTASRRPSRRIGRTRSAVAILVAAAVLVPAVLFGGTAGAATPTVDLATAGRYAILAGSTVTNTGNTVVNGSIGLWPGTSITGFPPGIVNPPGTIDVTSAAAQQAKADLNAAYVNAANRPLTATTAADLTNTTLVGGVYAGPSKGALLLSGPLTLDGQGDPNSVFIIQTNSSLTTASGSTVNLINGAQECNVFWQIGSSATLGASSVMRGTILADQSISLGDAVTVHGRTLAQVGAVTNINDTFDVPTCDLRTTTTTSSPSLTPSTIGMTISGGVTTTTMLGGGIANGTTGPAIDQGATVAQRATIVARELPRSGPGHIAMPLELAMGAFLLAAVAFLSEAGLRLWSTHRQGS